MREAGSVVSRERLIDEVWDVNWFGSTKTLDVHVSSLRRKLGDDSGGAALHPHGARRGLPLLRARGAGAGSDMSLRARLLLAFAYVLVLVIVALEVPLALNLSRRVDAEIRSEAQGRPSCSPPSRPGRLGDRARARAARPTRSARDLGGRVIVVGAARAAAGGLGRHRAARRRLLRLPPRDRERRCAGRPAQGERHSDSLDEDLLFTAVPVLSEGRAAGAVRVTQSVDAVQRRGAQRRDRAGRRRRHRAAARARRGVAAGRLARPAAARPGRRPRAGWPAAISTRAPRWRARPSSGGGRRVQRHDRPPGRALRAQREFVANASHQLRTPLTGLRLRLEAAALKTSDPRRGAELAAAERETERLARLLTELLTLARERERPGPKPLDLAEAAEAARERWEGPASAAGQRRGSTAGDGGRWWPPPGADLAAILDNLVENALNYSPAGTAVDDRVGRRGAAGRIVVLDDGPGIDADERERRLRALLPRRGQPRRRARHRARAVASSRRSRGAGAAAADRQPARRAARAPSSASGRTRFTDPDPQLDDALPGRG